MNIAFDSAAILGKGSKNRGIGNYSLDQFKTIINKDKDNHYFFFNLHERFNLSDYVNDSSNLTEVYFFSGKNNFLIENPEYNEIIGDLIKKFIRKYDIDIFYITSPFDNSNVLYQQSWFDGINVVATVYDIIPYLFQESYLPSNTLKKIYMKFIDMLRWVDKLLVISQSVKDDLVNYLNFDSSKIDVIYGAANDEYQEIVITKDEKNELYNKFGIQDKFVMCTGGDDYRKNLKNLIIAYSDLPKDVIDQHQLVIVCKLSNNTVESFNKIIQEKGLNGRIVLTNFVTNRELLQLYNLAYLMAFPSLYEGFGLPIVEAWSCATPVLTSNNSSLGEIAGDSAILVNPSDISDLTRGLFHALAEVDLEIFISKGKERLKLFQWSNVANMTIESLKNLNKKIKSRNNKLSIFISDQLSEIYLNLIKQLSIYYQIDLFTNSINNLDFETFPNINYNIYNKFPKKMSDYDEIIFMVDKSYNIELIKFIRKYHGIIVLVQNVFDGLDNIDKITNYSNKFIVENDEIKELLLRQNINRKVKTIVQNELRTMQDVNTNENVDNNTFSPNSIDYIVNQYIDFICDKDMSHLDEKCIYKITENEIINIQYENEEIEELVKTLSYIINHN